MHRRQLLLTYFLFSLEMLGALLRPFFLGLAINDLQPGAKQIVGEILGKVDDPMSTMLAGTGKLSLLTRRNQFFDNLIYHKSFYRH